MPPYRISSIGLFTDRLQQTVIKHRADAKKPNMGLMTWKNSPNGPIRKTDITVAKNYLTVDELLELNRIVNMYLDYAELQAKNRKPMHMADWVKKLDAFLEFNEQNILTHAGKVSHELAAEHAKQEFGKFEAERRQVEAKEPGSDFDKVVENIKYLENSNNKRTDSDKGKKGGKQK
ncbi:RhuM family protein [Candidatus Magnetomonas plexicatena]|uniref:RhuM family protein n=1 Tax=Candidatus Magnetomonas plexicatena TaxID=2552947 RepID=UPI0040328939